MPVQANKSLSIVVLIIGSVIVAGLTIWVAFQPNYLAQLGDPYYHTGHMGRTRSPGLWWSMMITFGLTGLTVIIGSSRHFINKRK